MENSSDEHSGSEEEIPQRPRVAGKAKVVERKSTKPPRAPKKKAESKTTDDDIPSTHSQPEDELVTDSKTMFSDGNPKKGGRGRERNTTAEMSDQETYRTPPERCLGQEDEKLRPAPPPNAHADSLKTIADFPKEVAKREKAKAKHEARLANKNQVEQQNVELTQQDVIEKKERASARKEKKKRKSVSPRASKKKSVVSKSKKFASASSDEESSDDNDGDEIPMYDQ
nr:uncharacterized protein LOC109773792 [Aegilops tauschii subsp. strangulata]